MKKVSSSTVLPVTTWLLALLALSGPAHGQPVSQLVAWGDNFYGQLDLPPDLTNVVAIASGFAHNLALRANGTVSAWGYDAFGQSDVPPGLSDVRAVAAGSGHSLALKSNGTLVAWGTRQYALNTVPAGLSNGMGIAAGANHNLIIKSDATVAGWGDNSGGQLNIPSGLGNVVAVAGGLLHSLALRANGALVAWGDDSVHQTEVPPGLSNVVAIAAGNSHNLALRANGTVVAWGYNNNGQINVPPGLSNVVAVACGNYYSLAVKADGTAVGWGNNASAVHPPVGLANVAALSAGDAHSLALVGSSPAIFAQPLSLTVVESSSATFSVGATGYPDVRYQWRFNGTNLAGATGFSFTLTAHLSDAGSYSVLVSNAFGSVTSAAALLTVNPLLVARCADVTVSADGNCAANASIDAGSTNPSGGTITLTQSPPGPYPLGTNMVTLIVSDDHGGSASCSARVIVLDRTPPQLTPPANVVTVNDPDQCGAIVNFAPPVASDACSAVTSITCTAPSGSFFPVGTTPVQCAATDAAGNIAATNFTVTVYDSQPPALVCPADIVVTNAHDAGTSVVTFSPAASDNCPGLGPVVCNPPSGSALAPGIHTINCSVTDAAGNSSACSFHVTVILNHAVTVTNPIPDQVGIFGAAFNFTLPPDTFADEDTRQTFTYAAFNLPPGISFTPETATFNGTFGAAGQFTVSVTATDNGEPLPLSATNAFVITVQKADPVLNWPALADIVYGTALGAGQFGATANTAGTFAYNPPAGTFLHAGTGQTLSVTFTPDDGADYNPVGTNVLINILKANLTATAADKSQTYGTVNPPRTINYSGFVIGDTSAVIDSPPVVSTTAAPTSPAGTYPITLTGGTDNDYNLALVNGTLTVTRAPLTVTADSATKVYGQPNPPFTGNIWGIQNHDNITAAYSSLATDTSLAGAYPIVPTLVDPDGKLGNYSVSLINGILTITPAALSVAITGPPSGFVRSVDTNILFTGVFTPSGASSSYLAWWTFSSDGMTDIVVPAIITNQTVSAQLQFAEAGVYNVSLTVSNESGPAAVATKVNNELSAYIVIYDPDGGFVTGGGWFNSSVGAYVLDPGLVGKATFGFVSRYQHGASIPTGQTVFTFQAADLNFHSTSYDWLLISGAKARYQGSGTINGDGDYAFILTAVDGQVNGGGGVDKLRVKIWEKQHNILIYDNQPGASDNSDPTTAIQAGSIVIHKE